MKKKTNRHVKLWLTMAVAILFWTAGAGFYHDLAAGNEETYKGLKIFSDVIELVEKNYVDPVDTRELIEKAIQGMVGGLDPHSALLPPEAFEELQIDTQGKFTGIGIHVTMRNGFVTVVSPIEGTPAYKAGIKAHDKIIKVDGEEISDLQTAVKKMRGPKGTTVKVTIVRDNVAEPFEHTLVRDVIPIHSVKATLLQPGYGYIWITNFREQTTDDLLDAMDILQANEAFKGLILDLRDNPGGILNQAISVSDVFLEDGIILSIKGRLERHTKVFKAQPNEVARDFPMVVLINGGSASASEIVAGALQDHKRAVILGTTSFGKGSVQTIENLRDGYGLKYTIARYYTPNGRSIQAKGVEPDIIVTPERIESAKDTPEKGLLKEKDLTNHLEAEPLKKDGEVKEPPENLQEAPLHPAIDLRLGPLMLEELRADNQIMRALEILKSYRIFKKLDG